MPPIKNELLYGINTISSLIEVNAGKRKIYNIYINSARLDAPRIKELISIAKSREIPFKEFKNKDAPKILNAFFPGQIVNEELVSSTQGLMAEVSNYSYSDLDLYLKSQAGQENLLVVLDGITDVGNFGAILRNCSAFKVNGVIVPQDRSVEANSRVSKISSGALEEVKVFKVINLVRTLKILKEKNFWIYGTTLEDHKPVKSADKTEYIFPLAIVFGSEGKGLSRLVKENCDFLVRIDTPGRMHSLNVSTSSGISLFIIRKYHEKDK